ncbi:MAG: thermonuclease family protein [Candidatus Limnocylindria bacterium]
MALKPERLLAVLIVLGVGAVMVAVVAMATAGPAPAAAPDASGGPVGPVERGRVVRVADGDTITMEIGARRERVRYVGVDAPEVANPGSGSPAECGADAATAANNDLVENAELVLERDATDRDRFGRLLRHPWIVVDGEWLHVSEELVRIGAIEARTFEPDTLHDRRLDRAERVARAAGEGIWGNC